MRWEKEATSNPRSIGGGWRSRWGGVLWADAGLWENNDNELTNNNSSHKESTRPRFLSMQRFLGRGGPVGVAVPQNEEEGSKRGSVSVEVVLIM